MCAYFIFQVEYLLREWVRLYHQPAAGKESEKAFSSFVAMVRDAMTTSRNVSPFTISIGFFFHFFIHFFPLFCFFHMTQLHQHGILKTDDLITRFFRISTELCVEATYRALIDHVSLHKGGRRYTVCSYQYAMVFSQRFFQSNCNRKYMT